MLYTDFEKTISWVASEVFDQTDQCLWSPVLEMASKIKLDETHKTYECLLEFHHNDDLALDVSFGILSSASLLPPEFVPDWWDLYVNRCDQLIPHKSFSDVVKIDNPRPKYRQRNTPFRAALPDYHYLEFDVLDNSIRLGGIFQRLDSHESELQPQIMNEILDYCLVLLEMPERTNECQKMLKDLFESLGCLFWIGLMVGRGDMIKLVFQSSVSLENIRPSFWQWFSPEFKLSFENAMKFLSTLEKTSTRCCLDLCLSKASTHPRLCFEIHPENKAKESINWSIFHSLQRHFNLKEDLSHQVFNLYNDLPRGVKKTPFSHIYPCPQLPFNSIAAIFSHYKICLEKDEPLQLKTYTSVISEL